MFISGVIFDLHGSYDAAFILAGSTVIIGIVLMFVVQRLIQNRPLHSESSIEITLPSKNNILSDDVTCVMNDDKRFLVNVHRRELLEEYSRPSSLVVSKVLEDLQSHEDNLHENFNALLVNSNSCLATQIEATNVAASSGSLKSLYLNCLNQKKQLSTQSSSSSVLDDSSSACAHSDSGTFSICDEHANTLGPQPTRVCSTDSDFVDDIPARIEYPRYGSNDVLLTNGRALKTTDDCASLLSEEDMFSSLMERALEEEVLHNNLVIFNSNRKITVEEHEPYFCSYQNRECRETIV